MVYLGVVVSPVATLTVSPLLNVLSSVDGGISDRREVMCCCRIYNITIVGIHGISSSK